jgi:hypothetical protein
MAGEKEKFWNHNHKSRRQYVALEHGTPLLSRQGGDIWFGLSLASVGLGDPIWPLICSLPRHRDLWSSDVKYCQLHCRAVNMFKRSSPLQKENRLRLIVHNSHFTTLYLPVSRRWCGKHYGPPSTKTTSCRLQLIIQESGLETPFRYLGACMP